MTTANVSQSYGEVVASSFAVDTEAWVSQSYAEVLASTYAVDTEAWASQSYAEVLASTFVPTTTGAHRFWRMSLLSGNQAYAMSTVQFRAVAGTALAFAGGTPHATENYNSTDTTGSYGAYLAADTDPSTFWSSQDANAGQVWEYDYGAGNSIQVGEVYVQVRPDNYYTQGPSSFSLDYSDDGTTWKTAQTYTGISWTSASQSQTFDVAANSGPPPALVNSLNPADTDSPLVLSNGNLTVTGTGASGGDRQSRGIVFEKTGKYYFEATLTSFSNADTGVGIANPNATGSALGDNGANGAIIFPSGNIYVNGAKDGSAAALTTGVAIGVAVDLTANLVWFRASPTGTWNGSSTASPDTGSGGYDISAVNTGSGVAVEAVIGSGSSDSATFNLGGGGFAGAVPAGFGPGWGPQAIVVSTAQPFVVIMA